MTVSSGSFAGAESDSVAFAGSSSPAAGALLLDQNGSHIVMERCGAVGAGCSAGADATALFPGGGSVLDRAFSSFGDVAFSCSEFSFSVGFFSGTGFEVNHPPNQPDDVDGLCGVSAAGGVSCISTSTAGATSSLELSFFASSAASFEVASLLLVLFFWASCTAAAAASSFVAGPSVSVSRTLGIVLTEA